MFSMFKRPGSQYRSKPFWSLNGDLQEQELRRQIRIFKQMGFGGFFMHSRVGLVTEYLSDPWFELMKSCVQEAAAQDMEAWLYDEDRWPSGAAGGIVTQDPRWQMKQMQLTEPEAATFAWPTTPNAAVFSAVFSNGRWVRYRRLQSPPVTRLADNERLLVFTLRPMDTQLWFNGQTYLDTLNPDAVAAFIAATHERYRQSVGDYFGKTIPGIFTDEPMRGAALRNMWDFGVSLPWTESLPKVFAEMFGYDIVDYLPELVFDAADGGFSQPRYHYYRCTTRMFAEAFSRQIGQWCQKNNLLFTGHVLEEQPLSHNVSVVGACMQFYEYMQAPGIDNLTQFWRHYLTAKQCISVARQMGRRWVLSELYGCTGWETTFETYKYIGDWQAALGITLRCPHLSHYTLAGEAKRDYPASIHFHSPWWKEYKRIEDYFARLNVLLTQGEPVCELAVIHPVESAYLLLNAETFTENNHFSINPQSPAAAFDASIEQLTDTLLAEHLDFDFVDEQILEHLNGSIIKDASSARPYLQIGRMKYAAVALPKLINLRLQTAERLKAFAEAGGCVIVVDALPSLLDGRPADTKAYFKSARIVPQDGRRLLDALMGCIARVDIADPKGMQEGDVIYQLRKDAQGYTLFLANTNRKQAKTDLTLTVPVDRSIRQAQWFEAWTGEVFEYPFVQKDKTVVLKLDLPATGSALLRLSTASESLPAYPNKGCRVRDYTLSIAPEQTRTDQPNVFVLDTAEVKAVTDDGRTLYAEQKEIIQIDQWLRDTLGLVQRGNTMLQPWASKHHPLGRTAQLTLTYQFDLLCPLSQDVRLALEQPSRWTAVLNGHPIDLTDVGQWWIDSAIRTVPLRKEVFRTGQNQLTLTGQFDRLTDLEIVYLLGDFGVQKVKDQFVVAAKPTAIGLGDWTQQGLAFYAGDVIYQAAVSLQKKAAARYRLKVDDFKAAAVQPRINGRAVDLIFYGDHEADITEAVQDGLNRVELRLLGSLRNAFGPLHSSETEPMWVGPDSYRRSHPRWSDAYCLMPYGLMKSPVIVEY